MVMKTHKGSCHCGAIRYEADIDLDEGTGKCNCTNCLKSRAWGVLLKPAQFRLLTVEDTITTYMRGGAAGACFCKVCGVKPFGRGDLPELGGRFVSVAVATLDDVTAEDYARLPVRFSNGRDNDWMNEPKVTSYL